MVYVPTFVPVHHRTPTALKAAPGFPEGQRRLSFSNTASSSPETTATGDNYLSSMPVLLPLSYCPGAMKFDYCSDDKNASH